MKKVNQIIIMFIISVLSIQSATAQQELNTEINVLFGLNQPLVVDGFNAELNVFYKHLAFDYSHGISLDFEGAAAPTILSDVGLKAHLPYSTGFGVGYRFNSWLNVRFEPKWHQFDILYIDDEQANPITTYNTTTLGIGLYGAWKPFKKQDNLLKGIMISPSIRYWYNVNSTLENDEFEYFNTFTNQNEIHEALNIGVNNTPLIVNLSIGYSVTL